MEKVIIKTKSNTVASMTFIIIVELPSQLPRVASLIYHWKVMRLFSEFYVRIDNDNDNNNTRRPADKPDSQMDKYHAIHMVARSLRKTT